MMHPTQAAPAAGADTRPDLGFTFSEDDHYRLARAEATAGLLVTLAETADMTGRPLVLPAAQLRAVSEHLQADLSTALNACVWQGVKRETGA